jgi:hypothetical protein
MSIAHVLTIDGWHPARLNQWDGHHWRVRSRLKKKDRELVSLYAYLAGIPRATGRRRVSLRLTLAPRQRAGDPDAYWKSTLDALVHAGLLVDDNRQSVELGEVTFERGSIRRTAIVLEDVASLPRRGDTKTAGGASTVTDGDSQGHAGSPAVGQF